MFCICQVVGTAAHELILAALPAVEELRSTTARVALLLFQVGPAFSACSVQASLSHQQSALQSQGICVGLRVVLNITWVLPYQQDSIESPLQTAYSQSTGNITSVSCIATWPATWTLIFIEPMYNATSISYRYTHCQ